MSNKNNSSLIQIWFALSIFLFIGLFILGTSNKILYTMPYWHYFTRLSIINLGVSIYITYKY
jgi:hypothetical protein